MSEPKRQFWFPFYAKDFWLDEKVSKLDLTQQGILVRAWCLCCMHGSIESDLKTLSKRIGIGFKGAEKRLAFLFEFFQPCPEKPERLISLRMLKESVNYKRKVEKLRETASLGGKTKAANARANARANANPNANPNANHDALANELANNLANGCQTGAETQTQTHISNEIEKPSVSCSEVDGATAEPTPASPVVMVLPCVGKGPKEWPVREAQLAQWREAFPGVDVLGELRKAKLWLMENPKKRKTFLGSGSFVLRWLGKAQDQGRPEPRHASAPKSRTPEADAAFAAQLATMELDDFGYPVNPKNQIPEGPVEVDEYGHIVEK